MYGFGHFVMLDYPGGDGRNRRRGETVGAERPEEASHQKLGIGRDAGVRGVGRRTTVGAYLGPVERILKEGPSLPTVEVLSRLRGLGYSGVKSALYELVKAVRPPKSEAPEVRVDGVLGEFSQHDFGSVRVTYADGPTEKVHFFASRLKYSRWTHVITVPNEKVEPLIRALLMAFESFAGVPLRALFDNPKTIVINRIKGHIEWNHTFAHVPVDYGFDVELCWPRRANQKSYVPHCTSFAGFGTNCPLSVSFRP